MALPNNITARVVPVFPANVVGQTGISVTKVGGQYRIAADLDQFGDTQGDILYRSGTAWTSLQAGTAGQILKTGGAGANPAWGNETGTPDGSITTAKLADGAVTLAKMADLATDKILGRDTTGTGDVEALGVTGGLEFTGSGGIQTSAFTGDVTKAAGGTALSIADDAVTLDKIAAATQGDILLYGAAGAPGVLAIGTAGQVPTVNAGGTALEYATPSAGGVSFVRGELAASVAANALTIELKNLAGDDPSAGVPVSLLFRSATLTSGAFDQVDVSAATSLVISSGSTLGATNGTPFRIWVVAFNDGGTVRLGAIRCSAPGYLYALPEWGVASSTAEGGAGAADSAGVIYTSSAVTSKPMLVLGFLSYESGLTTAGTWDAAPTVVQPFLPGTALPGSVIQSASAESTTTTNVTSSTYTTTSLSVSIAPKSTANVVNVLAAGSMIINTQGKEGQCIIQRGGTSIGTARACFNVTGGVEKWAMIVNVSDLPGTTSSTTYAVAISNDDGVTQIDFPGAQGQSEGGSITATEIMG